MAPTFFGSFEHSLDVKGRVILPARFRTVFGAQAFLSKYQDGCLALWTSDEFYGKLAEQAVEQEKGRPERNLARIMAAGSQEVDIDRQGRLAVPGFLREFAHLELESPILIVGILDRVEFWNPVEWDRRVKPAESQLTDEFDEPGVAAEAS